MRTAYTLLGVLFIALAAAMWFSTQYVRDSRPVTNNETSTIPMNEQSSTLSLTSTAFEEGASIPSRYTCDAEGKSPPLKISGVPEGTRSLALIVDDPDVPRQLRPDGVFDHWILFNIPPPSAGGTVEIQEDSTPDGGIVGMSGSGKSQYVGPCPPPQYEPSEHRYIFTLYALDVELDLKQGAPKTAVLPAIEGHVLAQTKLIGKYRRIKN